MTNTCPSLTDQLLGDTTDQLLGDATDLGGTDVTSSVALLRGSDTADMTVDVAGPVDASAKVNIGDVVGALDPTGAIGGSDCLNTDVLDGLTNGNPLVFATLSGPLDANLLVGGSEDASPYNALITADVNLPEITDAVPDLGGLPVDVGCLDGLLDSVDLPV